MKEYLDRNAKVNKKYINLFFFLLFFRAGIFFLFTNM